MHGPNGARPLLAHAISKQGLLGFAALEASAWPRSGHTAAKPVKRIAVSELLSGGREAVLLHGGDEYRLRLTSNGKLILTK